MSQAPQSPDLEIKSFKWEEMGETFRKHAPNESETLKTYGTLRYQVASVSVLPVSCLGLLHTEFMSASDPALPIVSTIKIAFWRHLCEMESL